MLKRLLSIFRRKQEWALYCGADGALLAMVVGRPGAVPRVSDYTMVEGRIDKVRGKMTIVCTHKKHGKSIAPLEWKQVS